ncbi:hypothetical protein [Veronia pacifica]|uniref:hypothetical protein n=1 Tax=Veronia pacifica TaxID=1080227 RepID=UPI001C304A15|nr:hypothetical protein [Veronia pacifica]
MTIGKLYLSKHSIGWIISTCISLVLVITLISLWVGMNNEHARPLQLVNDSDVDNALADWQTQQSEPMLQVKTGIFIQSL